MIQKWSYTKNIDCACDHDVAIFDDFVVVASTLSWFCIRASTGELIWSRDNIPASVIIGRFQDIIVATAIENCGIGSIYAGLYRIRLSDGTLLEDFINVIPLGILCLTSGSHPIKLHENIALMSDGQYLDVLTGRYLIFRHRNDEPDEQSFATLFKDDDEPRFAYYLNGELMKRDMFRKNGRCEIIGLEILDRENEQSFEGVVLLRPVEHYTTVLPLDASFLPSILLIGEGFIRFVLCKPNGQTATYRFPTYTYSLIAKAQGKWVVVAGYASIKSPYAVDLYEAH